MGRDGPQLGGDGTWVTLARGHQGPLDRRDRWDRLLRYRRDRSLQGLMQVWFGEWVLVPCLIMISLFVTH